jgi:predicted MFS family arabinose efflux permease
VVGAQGIAGLAKDFTKTASKSAIKATSATNSSQLFQWVAWFTGSKNAMKGLGFFVGGLLLQVLGFRGALWLLAALIAAILVVGLVSLPRELGKAKASQSVKELFAKSRAVNLLAAARIFLFGARDVWFVVSVPVFLGEVLGWSFTEIGTFLALWVIGYGAIQAISPSLLRRFVGDEPPSPTLVGALGMALAIVTLAIVWGVQSGTSPGRVILAGLAVFGIVFALNSAVHSYLVLAYAESERVSVTVGFYYMANAIGRLLGTLLSGFLYQQAGIVGSLWGSAALAGVAGLTAFLLPGVTSRAKWSSVKGDD